jgi:phenylacetate-coenzyme A ligase PaaK-like adenylate-forming protein
MEEIIKIIQLKDYKLNVEKNNKKNNININIETKNNVYDYFVDMDETENWIDWTVIDYYINKLLTKENIDKKFLPIPPEGQRVQFIFIDEVIYEKAKKIGIIPENQGYFIEKNRKGVILRITYSLHFAAVAAS